ncbi:D-glycero-beta-D-manno-heptose 1,7-bisphosphate 7-phosphatase [Ectothiorhodospiraceae bacterium BW-2]|nr:D-glycero-beta-D-manno-heptose 1,7-bisphosphate 7-phosphatase [Ectothiorhodospiraceae bacterium BW-2]
MFHVEHWLPVNLPLPLAQRNLWFHVKHLIILDRDGVINLDSDHYIRSVEEFIPLPGSLEAIAKLYQAGYQIAIATNQSGIGRGYYSIETLEAMHHKLAQLLQPLGAQIDYIAYCPHAPEAKCHCRKPEIGLFEQIAAHFQRQNLIGIPTVGDSLRDIETGRNMGCQTALVRSGKGERTIANYSFRLQQWQIPLFSDLAEYVNHLLKNRGFT